MIGLFTCSCLPASQTLLHEGKDYLSHLSLYF